MKFVEQYLTHHHLRHTPHRWLLALFLSPFHAAGKHYQKKYHISYRHAKKLFVIDILLIAGVLALFSALIYWHTYSPGITEQIDLVVSVPAGRIRSGDALTMTVTYKNNSAFVLHDVSLTLDLPPGFIENTSPAMANTTTQKHIFSLPDLAPENSNIVTINGRTYGRPETDIRVPAHLSYTPENSGSPETKHAVAVLLLRGSTITAALEVNDTIVANGTSPAVMTITNSGERIPESLTIEIPLHQGTEFQFVPDKTLSATTNNRWSIPTLSTGESITLKGALHSALPRNTTTATYTLTPLIKIDQELLPQMSTTKSFTVLHPEIEITSVWNTEPIIVPGERKNATITLKNTGSIDLGNIVLTVTGESTMVDSATFAALNRGVYSQNHLVLRSNTHPALTTLPKGKEITLTITYPFLSVMQPGTPPRFTPSITAEAVPLSTNTLYTTSATGMTALIGTQALFRAEARYYTNEGDQLGRGPLPPTVDKETKYWVFLTVDTTTSDLKNIRVNATLPPGVSWTNRTSVNLGKAITYSDSTRTLNWSLDSLSVGNTAGVYFELGLTPNPEHQGTTPPLLANIRLDALDPVINRPLQKTIPTLDSSLPTDFKARTRGVLVE